MATRKSATTAGAKKQEVQVKEVLPTAEEAQIPIQELGRVLGI